VEHSGQLVKEAQRQVEAGQKQVEASHEQARIAQDALAAAHEQTRISQLTLNAQIRPVLIDAPLDLAIEEPLIYPGRDGEPITGHRGGVHVSASETEVVVSLPLRNAGVGLAMIRGVNVRIATEIGQPAAMILPSNVAPGEYARVNFRATPGDAAFAPLGEVIQRQQNFSVEVGYSDLAGQQYTVSRFDVYRRPRAHYGWEVRQVHLQEPDADEPFTGSAPIA
jgi:hypothetical protein